MSWHNAGNWEGLGADQGAYILRDLFRAYNERRAAVNEAGINWLGVGTPTAEQIAGYALRGPEIRSALNQLIGLVYDELDSGDWYKNPPSDITAWTPAEIETLIGETFSLQASSLYCGQYNILREAFDRMLYRTGGYAAGNTYPAGSRYIRTGSSSASWASVVTQLGTETLSPTVGLDVQWAASYTGSAWGAQHYRHQVSDTPEIDGTCLEFYWDVSAAVSVPAHRNATLKYGAQSQALSSGTFRWTFAGFPTNDSLYIDIDYTNAATGSEGITMTLSAFGYFDLSPVLTDQV